MDEITLKALAKINLGLDVVRRREDGYHEVRMIMQTIHLYDLLEIQKIREPEIQIVSNLSFLPVNENNLVYKAARLLQEEFALTDGISVKLTKRIPVAAGMAGGSTDAAAMLYALATLFAFNLLGELLVRVSGLPLPGALEAVARLRTLSRTHLRQPLRSPQLQDRRPENADPSSH